MELRNDTPFPALDFDFIDTHGETFHAVVARVTFRIMETGELELAAEQSPLAMTDELYGSLGTSSVKEESDLSPYKPMCDVVVIGEAVAPGEAPAARFEAGLTLRRQGAILLDKRLTITGPRHWVKGRLPFSAWTLTEPEPIRSLPLRYEYAYGGECRISLDDPAAPKVPKKARLTPEQRAAHPDGPQNAPMAHTCFADNIVGKGYAEPWYLQAKGLRRLPAPQLESVRDPLKEFGRPYAVEGLGFIAKSTASRIRLAGTLDEAFIQSGKSLPEDFNFAYWNGAPADQQIPWLQGNEEITFMNIGGLAKVVLPEHRVCAEVRYPDQQMAGLEFNADTLILNAEQKTVTVVYRLKLPLNREIQSLEIQWLSKEERDILMQHADAVNRQVLSYQKAFQEAIR